MDQESLLSPSEFASNKLNPSVQNRATLNNFSLTNLLKQIVVIVGCFALPYLYDSKMFDMSGNNSSD